MGHLQLTQNGVVTTGVAVHHRQPICQFYCSSTQACPCLGRHGGSEWRISNSEEFGLPGNHFCFHFLAYSYDGTAVVYLPQLSTTGKMAGSILLSPRLHLCLPHRNHWIFRCCFSLPKTWRRGGWRIGRQPSHPFSLDQHTTQPGITLLIALPLLPAAH